MKEIQEAIEYLEGVNEAVKNMKSDLAKEFRMTALSALQLWIGSHKKVCKCDPENGMCICGAFEHNQTLSGLIDEMKDKK